MHRISDGSFPPTAVPAHQVLDFPEHLKNNHWTVAPELFLPESQVSYAFQLFRLLFPAAHGPTLPSRCSQAC